MATNPDPHGPVFVTAKGTGYVYVSFYALFKRAREAAGLLPRGRARPRLHDLRHTFATAHMTAAYATATIPSGSCPCWRPGSGTPTPRTPTGT